MRAQRHSRHGGIHVGARGYQLHDNFNVAREHCSNERCQGLVFKSIAEGGEGRGDRSVSKISSRTFNKCARSGTHVTVAFTSAPKDISLSTILSLHFCVIKAHRSGGNRIPLSFLLCRGGRVEGRPQRQYNVITRLQQMRAQRHSRAAGIQVGAQGH